MYNTHMKTIIIYGGAFNPPTIAHQRILQAGIDWGLRRNEEVEAWVLPSGENNKKKTGIPRAKHIKYCDRLIDSVNAHTAHMRIEPLELDSTTRTDKTEIAQIVSSRHPEADVWWIYGADSMDTIDAWGGNWLKKHTNILVAPRDEAIFATQAETIQFLDVDTSGVPSSTIVRNRIRMGLPIEGLVPDMVLSAINKSLYS